MSDFGVFDIIGPRMIGPSSSHTAGAARLAYVAWKIAGRAVKRAELTLYGSFAETGRGHGTDKALTAGILGMQPDDENLARAPEIAKERGIDVEVVFNDESMEQPNTARIRLESPDGVITEVVGASIGGGNIRITEIDGLNVELNGEYPTLLVRHHDVPGVITEITHLLAENEINIAFMQVFRHGRGEDAFMTIETDEAIPRDLPEKILSLCPEIHNVRTV